MPPPPDSEMNPYAPPGSDVSVQKRVDRVLRRRPPSVKWALAYCNLVLVATWAKAWSIHERQQILKDSFADVPQPEWITPELLIRTALYIIPLILFNFSGRRRIGYQAGVVCLALICCQRAVEIPNAIALFDASLELVWPIRGLWFLIFSGLVGWLFYRFTFGQASRLYYRFHA